VGAGRVAQAVRELSQQTWDPEFKSQSYKVLAEWLNGKSDYLASLRPWVQTPVLQNKCTKYFLKKSMISIASIYFSQTTQAENNRNIWKRCKCVSSPQMKKDGSSCLPHATKA
jgi:hypothetical protein